MHLISGDPSRVTNEISIPGVTVHFLPEKKLKNHVLSFGYNLLRLPLIISELKCILKEVSPDVIHAHQVYVEGFWAALSGFHPLVVTPIGSDLLVHPYESAILRAISRYVLGKADLITSDSVVLQHAIYKFGGAPEKTHLIFNGVDFLVFNPAIDKKRIRDRYEIGNSPLILCVRGLDPIYNVDYVIKAIPGVLKVRPDAKFMFCYVQSSADVFNPQTLVEELGLEKSVILAGMVSREEMPFYYAAADICVSVPSSDSSPSSVYEAMACGTPVILSDIPWTRHFILDRQNALVVPVRDSETIAASILEILSDNKLRKQLTDNAYTTIREHVDYSVNMEKMEDLMKNLLQKG